MDRESRKKKVAHCLVDMGETITSWAAKNGLHQKIVSDLVDGKLKGTGPRPHATMSILIRSGGWISRPRPL